MSSQDKIIDTWVLGLKICVVWALLILAGKVLADPVTLTWEAPTEAESYVPAGALTGLAGTRIWVMVAEITDPDVTEYVITGLAPGTYAYKATAFTETGEESRMSATATKVVEALTAAAGTPVKTVVRTSNGFILLPVGTTSEAVTCDPANGIKGHFAVPRASVTWTGTVRPQVVVAECI